MTAIPFDSKQFLKNLTEQSGVYRMYDIAGTVIYVGKAKNLKKRVASYFRSNITNTKTQALVSQIAQMDVTITHTEIEALVLENNFIKQYMPKYNVLLRDDKSYPYIKISNHKHPRLAFHRGAKKDKASYFGPYPSGGAVGESLRIMQKIFPIRQCEDNYYAARSRPCLQYQLKRCLAPCIKGLVTDQAYSEQIHLAKLFLQGRNQDVMTELVKKMEVSSLSLEFESAARYRDQITALRKIQEQQYVTGNHPELDILGFGIEHGIACIHVLYIRDSKILGSKSFFPKMHKSSSESEILTAFVAQFYLNQNQDRKPGKEIVLPFKIDEQLGLEDAIRTLHESKTKFTIPTRGEKHKYLALASTNALNAVKTKLTESASMEKRFNQLDQLFDLSEPINRIECFDISHTMGQQTVASCVVFNRNGPLKTDYRRYNIEGITPGDDYAAMAQVLSRRYRPPQPEDKIPDIVFIDGGKGQLAQAEQHFIDWQQKMPLLVGVAKGTSRKPGLETLIMAGSHLIVNVATDSPALHLIQHIRDESHRFAITGHRHKRQQVKTTSTLEQIPGIGAKRRQALLKYMGGIQMLKTASVAQIAQVPGISKEIAQIVFDHLQSA